jgi:hypothetical protein
MPKYMPSASPGEKSSIPKPRDLPEECSLLRIFLGEGDEYLLKLKRSRRLLLPEPESF